MGLHENHEKYIEDFCRIVRNVIVKSKSNTSLFKDFPFGCCRDSSIIIGEILKDVGVNNVYLCRKEIDDKPSHTWIEFDNWIIDITADQFGLEFSTIIVLYLESPYWFHKESNREICSFSIVGIDALNLFDDYKLIRNEIGNLLLNFTIPKDFK